MAHEQIDTQGSSVKPTEKMMQYWKTALAALATVGVIATCIYFPPAALFLSPAVEFLVANMAFAGAWAGFAAFGTVVACVAALTFGVTRVVSGVIETLITKCFGADAPADEYQLPQDVADAGETKQLKNADADDATSLPKAPDIFASVLNGIIPPKVTSTHVSPESSDDEDSSPRFAGGTGTEV